MTDIANDALAHRTKPVWRCTAVVAAITGFCLMTWALAILLPGIGQELLFTPETAFAARLIAASSIVLLGLPFLLLSGGLLLLAFGSLCKLRLAAALSDRGFSQTVQSHTAS